MFVFSVRSFDNQRIYVCAGNIFYALGIGCRSLTDDDTTVKVLAAIGRLSPVRLDDREHRLPSMMSEPLLR